MFETECIIYRPDLHNSLVSRKNLKKYLMVEAKLSMSKPKISSAMNNASGYLTNRKMAKKGLVLSFLWTQEQKKL